MLTTNFWPGARYLYVDSGHAEGWGTAVECQVDACTGTVAAYSESSLCLVRRDRYYY